jgi:SSS family solute:Na+ symporter
MTLVPGGLRGLVFAALIAAIVSSLASMMNSISTIFTMDIYRDYIAKERTEGHYVLVGRLTALTAMVIALILAKPFLGGMESAFQTIQEYTGFIAPGVVAVFLLGFFWARTNTAGAFALLISSVVLSIAAKLMLPDLPFVLRIWIVFLVCLVVGVVVSLLTPKPKPEQPVDLGGIQFDTKVGFNIAAVLIVLILAAIYVAFW